MVSTYDQREKWILPYYYKANKRGNQMKKMTCTLMQYVYQQPLIGTDRLQMSALVSRLHVSISRAIKRV